MHLIAIHRLAELVAAFGGMTSTGVASRLISRTHAELVDDS